MAASNVLRLQRILLDIAEHADASRSEKLEAAEYLTRLLEGKPKRGRPTKRRVDASSLLGRKPTG